MSKKPYWKRRKRRSKIKLWFSIILILVTLAFLLYTTAVITGYNPFFRRQLHAQFGTEFFTDFGEVYPERRGKDLDSIVNYYEESLQELEDKALERLEELFVAAIDEYERKESSGNLDRFMLTNKYIQAGRMLENNVDALFYDLLDEMKSELEAEGYSLRVTADIEEAYKKAKSDKMRELLDRLRNKISSSNLQPVWPCSGLC